MKKSRYTLLASFVVFFWMASFGVRTAHLMLCFAKAGLSVGDIIGLYLKGFVFDTAVAVYFSLPYAFYLLVLPQKQLRSAFNRRFTYVGFFLTTMIILFSFFAEFPFWEEFESRFNFIAVDYLIYTYEVVNNIHQSYPLPLLIAGMIALTAGVTYLFHRLRLFQSTFLAPALPFARRLLFTGGLCVAALLAAFFLPNSMAEGENRYGNELGKAGIYSFFAAFKNNELDYYAFYPTADETKNFHLLQQELAEPDAQFLSADNPVRRHIRSDHPQPQTPNIILIAIESFSADFMEYFGNDRQITPFIDSLARQSLLFTQLYATGTRTVRGMEALALGIPPTPGNSIVRRPGNSNLFSIGTVFHARGYQSTFLYGGDGYFDNMNAFFGNNHFDLIDRGRKLRLGDTYPTRRTTIPDSLVRFQNAWGISDQDLYEAALRDADRHHGEGQPFFQFIMTTSNHRPYTYPEGTVDIPSGSGRDGAVKYTDYAIRQYISQMQDRPWFPNTIIVLVADHCASSAGKNQIDVSKYHIPCLIYNLQTEYPSIIDRQCSQIDIFPTLFALLGWSYDSGFFGRNVLSPHYRPRTFVGTYQKLGYVEEDRLLILSPNQASETFRISADRTELTPLPLDSTLLDKAAAYYQTASFLFMSGGMGE